MRKRNLLRLCICLAVALFELPLLAQGVIVYKTDGTQVKYPYEEIDSIVTYNVDVKDDPVVSPADARAVDLGLSVKWASCNVGAESPEEYGDYFAWGETEAKDDYSWSTYKWCNGDAYSMTKYCTDSDYGTVDNKTVLEPEDDAATANWGGNWRMPTEAELDELRTECTWTWITLNGVNGYEVTGPNGNSIFLPAAGNRYGTEVYGRGSVGHFCSATLIVGSDRVCSFYLSSGLYALNPNYIRIYGFSVRPVTE